MPTGKIILDIFWMVYSIVFIWKNEDPEHNGEYSNSWYSYAWMTARRLGAELHDIAQGGIALLDHTGWFAAPEYIGMEQVYDKITDNPELGDCKLWDFSAYTPHVVVIAIGQNDNHPDDYMAGDPGGAATLNGRFLIISSGRRATMSGLVWFM